MMPPIRLVIVMYLSRRVGAVAGFAAPVLAFACIVTAIAFYPSFSWTDNALSDLGVVAGVTGPLFNFGLIAAGVLALVFAVWGLFSFSGKSRVSRVGSLVFAAASAALVCIGVFNENFSPTHYLVSVAFFTLAPIALFILTCGFYLNRRKGLAAFSVAIGIIAALPWILQFTINYVPRVAIPEAVSALAVSAWAILLSTKMLQKENVSQIGKNSTS